MDERVERNLQLQEFIGKNTRRYCDIFEQNEGKKTFLHTNWAAFFFGPTWMFYRSMWLWGTAMLVVQYLIIFIVEFLIALLYVPEIVATGYISSTIMLNITAGALVVVMVARFIFSLFADCIYRAFVNKHLGTNKGGVSIASVVVASFVSAVVTEVVDAALSFLLVVVAGVQLL